MEILNRINNDFLFKTIRIENFILWLNDDCNNIVDFEYKRFCDTYRVNVGKFMFVFIMCTMNNGAGIERFTAIFPQLHIINVFKSLVTYENLYLPKCIEIQNRDYQLYIYYQKVFELIIDRTEATEAMQLIIHNLFGKLKDYINISAMNYQNVADDFCDYIDSCKDSITHTVFNNYIIITKPHPIAMVLNTINTKGIVIGKNDEKMHWVLLKKANNHSKKVNTKLLLLTEINKAINNNLLICTDEQKKEFDTLLVSLQAKQMLKELSEE